MLIKRGARIGVALIVAGCTAEPTAFSRPGYLPTAAAIDVMNKDPSFSLSPDAPLGLPQATSNPPAYYAPASPAPYYAYRPDPPPPAHDDTPPPARQASQPPKPSAAEVITGLALAAFLVAGKQVADDLEEQRLHPERFDEKCTVRRYKQEWEINWSEDPPVCRMVRK